MYIIRRAYCGITSAIFWYIYSIVIGSEIAIVVHWISHPPSKNLQIFDEGANESLGHCADVPKQNSATFKNISETVNVQSPKKRISHIVALSLHSVVDGKNVSSGQPVEFPIQFSGLYIIT